MITRYQTMTTARSWFDATLTVAGWFDQECDVAAAAGTVTGTGAIAAPAGAWAAQGQVTAAAAVVVPDSRSGGGGGGGQIRRPRRRQVMAPRPVVISGAGGWTAPAGAWTGAGSVSTARLDHEEAYLLGLEELEEAA